MEKKYMKWMLLLAMAFPMAIFGCAEDGSNGSMSGDRYDPDGYDDGDEGTDESGGTDDPGDRLGGDVGAACSSDQIPICSINAPNPRDRTRCVFSECDFETEVCTGTCESFFCDPGEGEDACLVYNVAEQMMEEDREAVIGTPPSIVTRFVCNEAQNDLGETVHLCIPTIVDLSPEEDE